MFNSRQLNPVQVSAINAFTISLLVGIANYIFIGNWWIAILSFVVLLIISYLLIRYFTERFIYRHIKLIYKFISQTKATKREEFFYKSILPEKSLQEVSKEVEEWAEQKKQEIETLQQNEQYRKEFLQKTTILLAAALTGSAFDFKKQVPLLSFSTLGCPDWSFYQIVNFAKLHQYQGIEVRGLLREMELPECPEFSDQQIATTLNLMNERNLKFAGLGSSASEYLARIMHQA